MKELAAIKDKSALDARLSRLEQAIALLDEGFKGNPQSLGKTDAESIVNLLALVNIELVTMTTLTKRGHILRRGQKPVMKRYYGSPIKRYADLYVFGAQTRPKPQVKTT